MTFSKKCRKMTFITYTNTTRAGVVVAYSMVNQLETGRNESQFLVKLNSSDFCKKHNIKFDYKE
ncbi:MAG: hypothetical protein LBE09_03385 [Christensenellaceae bacterium]|jgi:hypothetical protein|nr:hypothetical protein [Christensenellaceae bacterium]